MVTLFVGIVFWILNGLRQALPLLALASLATGCASISRGTKETLRVESEPTAAGVRLSTGATGQTPAAFKLPRAKPLTVTISKEGYSTTNVAVKSVVSGKGAAGFLGNAVFGGIIGAAVDAGSGATKDLKPNPVRVTLEKLPKNDTATTKHLP